MNPLMPLEEVLEEEARLPDSHRLFPVRTRSDIDRRHLKRRPDPHRAEAAVSRQHLASQQHCLAPVGHVHRRHHSRGLNL